MRTIPAAALGGLVLTACAGAPPPDTSDPIVELSAFDPAPMAIGSTDPAAAVGTGCPVGRTLDASAAEDWLTTRYGPTSWTAKSAGDTYFYSDSAPPHRLALRVRDPGGVRLARVEFADGTIDAETPNGSIVIADVAPETARIRTDTRAADAGGVDKFRLVERRLTDEPDDLPDALDVAFTASGSGTAPYVSVVGEDAAGNSAGFFLWLLPQALCR